MKNQNIDDRPEARRLLSNIKNKLPSLQDLLKECNDHWEYEDPIYRFYHQSNKVFEVQHLTQKIVAALHSLSPDSMLNPFFLQIIEEGTGKKFSMQDNDIWLERTRPMLESFFHAKFFLEMAVKYGSELTGPPKLLPSGWAALLYLYNLR